MLPYELRDEFVKGNLVLFVGAGFVRSYLPTMPLWHDLLKQVFASLNGNANEIFDYCDHLIDAAGNRIIPPSEYLRLAQKFELTREVVNKDRRNLGLQEIPSIHEQVRRAIQTSYNVNAASRSVEGTNLSRLKDLPLTSWVTTNYDTFLEDTILAEGIKSKSTGVLKRPIHNVDFGLSAGAIQTLLKIQGCVLSDPDRSIVITEEDYYRFLREEKYITNKLYTLFCERTVVFLGYGLNDPNIQFIYHEVLFDQKTLATQGEPESFSQFRPSFFVTERAATGQEKAYFRHKRIRYVEGYSVERFFGELLTTFERDRARRAGITETVRGNIGEYQDLYARLDWNTDPETIDIPEEEKHDYVAKLFDLVELNEVVYRQSIPPQPSLPEFDRTKLSGVVQGSLHVIEQWCASRLQNGGTAMLEDLLEFMERRLTQYRKGVFKGLLRTLSGWPNQFRELSGIRYFIGRYCQMLFNYDRDYNDWDDYTYCLEHYVSASSLLPHMTPALKGEVIRGLYEQLDTCGRDRGDSWYTTNRVYDIWDRFDPAAWPQLETEIRSHLPGQKQQAMLDHLRPGADFRKFLPRE